MSSSGHTLDIINFLICSKEPRRLIEISKNLSISNTTVYRILASLENGEWVLKDHKSKRYTVGGKLLEMALFLVSQLDLRNVSLPYLEELYSKVKESVMLSSRVGSERMYIEQLQCNYELRYIVDVGRRFPLWLGAPGKAILAYMQQSEIEVVIETLKQSEVRFLASGQSVNIDNLRKELAKIRNQGFSLSKGERVEGTIAIAAPIFGRDRQVIGAISTGGPKSRFNLEIATNYGPLVDDIAKKISLQMGNIHERD